MSQKAIIITCVLVLSGAGIGLRVFFAGKEAIYQTAEVERKDIVQTVQVTGEVTADKRIDLRFEVQGRIKQVKRRAGSEVGQGEALAFLESRDFEIDVAEAEALYKKAQAGLEKTIAGASDEEVQVYKKAVKKAEAAVEEKKALLEQEEIELADIRKTADDGLRSAYEDGLNALRDAEVKADAAFNDVDAVQRAYFYFGDQESLKVKNNEALIRDAAGDIENYSSQAQITDYQTIESGLEATRGELSSIYDALKVIRESCEGPFYRNTVLSSDKSKLDNHKLYMSDSLTDIVEAKQAISNTKLGNQSNINSAQSSVESAQKILDSAKADLGKAQAEFNKIEAPAREEDVALAQAEVAQALAALNKTQNELSKTRLFTPCDGTIASIEKEEGELVAVNEDIASLICEGEFQIEADVPETEIGKINLGDNAVTSLDSFPGKFFSGKIIEIDPAETIVQGVVYYTIKLSIDDNDGTKGQWDEGKEGLRLEQTATTAAGRIRPGMTAEVEIITASREGVLSVPQRAVFQEQGKKFVRVKKGEVVEKREIETGIRDKESNVEVISGLEAGEEVVTFINSG